MSTGPGAIRDNLRLWFSFDVPVDGPTYLRNGVGLMAIKYLADAAFLWLVAGIFWSPLEYLQPFWSVRHQLFSPHPAWIANALLVITLPFLWIGVSMTARRAVDAGMPSWTALLFFVPIVNYLVMGLLAIVPSRRRPVTSDAAASPLVSDRFRSALQGVAAAVAITLATLAVGVYFKRAYSTGLFLGVPFTIGYISAYLYNRPVRRPARESIGLAFLSTMIAAGAMVIFALEGVVCAAMAIPLAGRDRDSRSAPRSGRGRQRGAGRRWWHYAALAVADLARAARRQQGSGCCHDRGDRRGTRNRLA